MANNRRQDSPDERHAAIDPEMLARAERAVAALNEKFAASIEREIAELRDLIDRLAAAPDDDTVLKRIFDIAHDLHGQGGSFGYPLISRIGAALCRFIDPRDSASPAVPAAGVAALRVFTDAAAAVIAKNVTDEDDAVARAAVENLERLADGAVRAPD